MTQQAPLVTLVTPTYNQARYLQKSLDSVLEQTYPNIEYIVINDGSSDDTESVLSRYDGRVNWSTQANQGQAATLNAGWKVAQGKYIGYLSSDDLLAPDAVARLVAVLEQDPSVVCVYPDCDLIDEHGVVVKRGLCKGFDLEELVVRQECHIGPGALFRADGFRRVGGWKTYLHLAPDREFWMRLAGEGSIRFLPESLAGYRLHAQSISYQSTSDEQSKEYLQVLDEYFAGNVAPSILARKQEAYAFAYFLMARNAMRSGRPLRGGRYFVEACSRHRGFMHPRYLLQLVRNTLSKPVRVAMARVRARRLRAD
ncbi:glycosyltransferase [Pseudomonas sp. PS02288]|uniref:glycosyltransferase n=1 Tax=Pseudomonas sp. PS02288 TaxID=2991443 RepID=UPI00249A5382|nr:glycosyltransferase [Pseudomonas sp. PS02288]